MRRAEMARRRRNLSDKRNEEVKVCSSVSPRARRRLTSPSRWRPSTSFSRSRPPRPTSAEVWATRLQMMLTGRIPCSSAGSARRRATWWGFRMGCSSARLAKPLVAFPLARWWKRCPETIGPLVSVLPGLFAISYLFLTRERARAKRAVSGVRKPV